MCFFSVPPVEKWSCLFFERPVFRDIFFVVVVDAYVVIARGFSGLQRAGDC